MNDTIRVGDRVWASGLGDGRMLAIDGNYGWVLWNTHDHCTARLDSLTRIEPEPVTLRPKYAVGEKVRIKSIAGCAGESVVSRPSLFYDLGWRGWWREDKLEPVPESCEK